MPVREDDEGVRGVDAGAADEVVGLEVPERVEVDLFLLELRQPAPLADGREVPVRSTCYSAEVFRGRGAAAARTWIFRGGETEDFQRGRAYSSSVPAFRPRPGETAGAVPPGETPGGNASAGVP